MTSENFVAAILICILLLLVGVGIFGCYNKFVMGNKQFIDLKQTFNVAYISYPDGTFKKIKVKVWKDYDNSDSIQIVDEEGKPIYTHLSRVILTKE